MSGDCGAPRHYLDRGNGRSCATCGEPPFIVAATCANSNGHGAHHWTADDGDYRYCPGAYS